MGKGRIAHKPVQRQGKPPAPVEDNNWKLAPTAMPTMPKLPPVAASEWMRLSRYLTALDRVASVDRQALSTYCLQWAVFSRIMRDELSPEGVYLFDDGPTCEVAHPLLTPLLRSGRAVLRMAGQFGMTARTRDLESSHGNRKASALKRLMGNQRKIAEGRLAPSILPILPDFGEQDMQPPDWLNARARAEFEQLGAELKILDLFTPLDLVPLVIVSSLFDLYMRANEQMRTLYTSVLNKEGVEVGQKEHPLFKASSEILEVMHMVWKDYGQTPRYRKVFNGEQKVEGKEIPIIFKGRFG